MGTIGHTHAHRIVRVVYCTPGDEMEVYGTAYLSGGAKHGRCHTSPPPLKFAQRNMLVWSMSPYVDHSCSLTKQYTWIKLCWC